MGILFYFVEPEWVLPLSFPRFEPPRRGRSRCSENLARGCGWGVWRGSLPLCGGVGCSGAVVRGWPR